MTGTTSPSPLIDRYIYDVVRRLPKDQRKDIELELRALIDDILGGAAEDPRSRVFCKTSGSPPTWRADTGNPSLAWWGRRITRPTGSCSRSC